ncbi:MAG TPA: hypothetical protein H9850_09075, partial [Candidatus Anaerobiospirillum pullistercoris]|nr:hypothetical protein [Candidatus Anaerobiospirillum pullistercoris]
AIKDLSLNEDGLIMAKADFDNNLGFDAHLGRELHYVLCDGLWWGDWEVLISQGTVNSPDSVNTSR